MKRVRGSHSGRKVKKRLRGTPSKRRGGQWVRGKHKAYASPVVNVEPLNLLPKLHEGG